MAVLRGNSTSIPRLRALRAVGKGEKNFSQSRPIRLGVGKAGRYDPGMKIFTRSVIAGLFATAASVAISAVPTLNVTVLDSSGKTAFKGATDSRGIFASPKMGPGNYSVQFTSKNAPKETHYTVVVVAGTKKTSASA